MALTLVLCFILVGAARIGSTYRQLSITTDEPEHFACGLEYLGNHQACGIDHPPLEHAAAALLPFLYGARYDGRFGLHAVLRNLLLQSSDPWRLIARMRAGVLPFFLLAVLVVYGAARWCFGAVEALVAAAAFTLMPPVLAHAGLATTDIAVTATLPAAAFLLAWWAEAPSWKSALAAGAAVGLAVLSKFTTLVYLPAVAAIAAAFWIAVHRPHRDRLRHIVSERAPTLGLAVVTGAAVIWAGYLFSYGRIPGSAFSFRVPAPEMFWTLGRAWRHGEAGHSAYLLGHFGATGWWYFFPVALAVKTPIALFPFIMIGIFASFRLRRERGLLPLALSLGVLLPAMFSHITIGVRHVLPVYAGLCMLAGLGAVHLVRWAGALPGTAAVLLLFAWMAYSGAQAHPDYLAYFNEFASDSPDRVLLDSDLDWRQDYVLVARRLRELHAGSVCLDFAESLFNTPATLTRIYGLPPLAPPDPVVPAPGWHAVGLTDLHLQQGGGEYQEEDSALRGVGLRLPWYRRMRPVDRVGGMVLFRVPPDFVP